MNKGNLAGGAIPDGEDTRGRGKGLLDRYGNGKGPPGDGKGEEGNGAGETSLHPTLPPPYSLSPVRPTPLCTHTAQPMGEQGPKREGATNPTPGGGTNRSQPPESRPTSSIERDFEKHDTPYKREAVTKGVGHVAKLARAKTDD